MEVQSYLFDKSKDWNLEKAKAWFEKHRENVVKEHFTAVMPFQVLKKIVDKPLRIRGVAMTVGMSRNRNIYTPEELQNFANKLVSAPVYVEHVAVPNAVGKVVKTEFDGRNLWYEAEIYDDEIAEKIRKGLIQHVSVGADYETLDILDGKVPHGLHNAELSLVAVPGIPQTNIHVLESYAPTGSSAQLQKPLKEREEMDKENRLTEAEWDTEYINRLPDECFAYIEPGGEKDKEGKTKPRSLRHLPYKNAQSEIDHDHLVNALARLPQTSLSPEAKAEAKRKLCAAVKQWNSEHPDNQITSEVCNVEPPTQEQAQTQPTLEDRVSALETKISDMLTCIERLEQAFSQPSKEIAESLVQKPKEPLMPVRETIQILEGLLPSPAVERSTLGMQRECQEIRRAIWKLKERMKNVQA